MRSKEFPSAGISLYSLYQSYSVLKYILHKCWNVLARSEPRYRIGKKIANGAFGQLRLVKDLSNGEVRGVTME